MQGATAREVKPEDIGWLAGLLMAKAQFCLISQAKIPLIKYFTVFTLWEQIYLFSTNVVKY